MTTSEDPGPGSPSSGRCGRPLMTLADGVVWASAGWTDPRPRWQVRGSCSRPSFSFYLFNFLCSTLVAEKRGNPPGRLGRTLSGAGAGQRADDPSFFSFNASAPTVGTVTGRGREQVRTGVFRCVCGARRPVIRRAATEVLRGCTTHRRVGGPAW
jgi:hypothetical protein